MPTVRGAGLESVGKVRSTHRTEEQNEFVALREGYLKQLQRKYNLSREQAMKVMESRGGLSQVRDDVADKPEADEAKKKREDTLRELVRLQRERQRQLGV